MKSLEQEELVELARLYSSLAIYLLSKIKGENPLAEEQEQLSQIEDVDELLTLLGNNIDYIFEYLQPPVGEERLFISWARRIAEIRERHPA